MFGTMSISRLLRGNRKPPLPELGKNVIWHLDQNIITAETDEILSLSVGR